MGNRLEHVAANREIERVVRELQSERVSVREAQPAGEVHVVASRQIDVRRNNVYRVDGRFGKQRGESGRDLARAATGVENSPARENRLA
jgi:hypothetical protein